MTSSLPQGLLVWALLLLLAVLLLPSLSAVTAQSTATSVGSGAYRYDNPPRSWAVGTSREGACVGGGGTAVFAIFIVLILCVTLYASFICCLSSASAHRRRSVGEGPHL